MEMKYKIKLISPQIGFTTSITIINHNQDLERSIPFGIALYHRENALFVTDKGFHSVKKINALGMESYLLLSFPSFSFSFCYVNAS